MNWSLKDIIDNSIFFTGAVGSSSITLDFNVYNVIKCTRQGCKIDFHFTLSVAHTPTGRDERINVYIKDDGRIL